MELPPLHPALLEGGLTVAERLSWDEVDYAEVCAVVAALGPAQCGVLELAAVLCAEFGLGPVLAEQVADAFEGDLERLAVAARARLRQRLWQAAVGELRLGKDEQSLALAAARETLGWAGSTEIAEIRKAIREAEKDQTRRGQ